MQILARNRYELYLSVGLVLASFIAHRIYGYAEGAGQALIIFVAGLRFLALLCVANALADQRRMSPFQRVVSVPWLLLILYFTAVAVWECITFHPYIPADR